MASDENTAITISRVFDMVVLTMTPQRAQLIAASIWLGDADHRAWIDDLSTTMEAAAAGEGVFGQHSPSDDAHTTPVVVELDLPLRRDRLPAAHDPSLDTLYSPEALGAALASPSEISVATALRAVTRQAAVEASQAVDEAAAVAAGAAQRAQIARAVAAEEAAKAMKVLVSQTAAAVQLLSDARIQFARGINELDHTTIMNIARETHVAAVTVAQAAARAAMQAATAAADSAMDLELEVATTAAAVAAVADETADRLAARAETAAALLNKARRSDN